MANNTLGTIRGTIEIDYDGAGIVKAVRDTDKAKDAMGGLDKSVSSVLTTFRKFSKTAALMGASSLALHSSLQLVAGVLAVMGPLVGAGLAALPGILAGAAAAGIIAKVAFAGMGDALKAATGDAAAFDEAIKNLAPSAQEFARSVRSALQALKPMQQAIQGAFFSGLGPEVRRIATGLTSLRDSAVGVAQMMNLLAREALGAVRDMQFEGIETILEGVKDFLREIHGSIGPVVKGFISMAAQASQFGGALGEKVGTALFRFGQFMQNVDVAAVFERALPILQTLGQFLSDLGTIGSSLFTVFNVDGQSAAGVLGELTGKLAAFLQSAEGQEALRALGEAMAAISGSAGQIFLTLLQALAPIIVALAPGIAQLATQIAAVLVPAIQTLAPLLESLAGFLSANMDWVGPLALAIVAAAAAYRTYTAAVKAWAAIEAAAQTLRLKSVGQWIANTAAIVANRIAIAAHAVATAATRIPVLAAMAAQWLWNASLYGFPLVWIIAAIVAVIAIVVLLVKNWDSVLKFFDKAWEVIKDLFQKGLDFVLAYWKFVWGLVMAYIEFVINFWKAVFQGVWDFIKNVFQGGINFIKNLFQLWLTGLGIVIGKVRELLLKAAQFFTDLRNAVVDRIKLVLKTVLDMPGKILSALGNMGRLLYNKGRDLIQGFIDGLRSMLRKVQDVAGNIASAVTDFLPGSPAKKGPLSGRGYALLRARRMMEDLAKGISDAQGLPVAAMAGAVRPVAAGVSGGLSGASTVRPSTTTVTNNNGGGLSVGQVVVRGVFDPTDPASTRQLVGNLHEALDRYAKEYR